MGRDLACQGSATPHPRCVSAPQCWGFSSISAYIFGRRTTKSNLVTHTGRGLIVLRDQPRPQGGGAPQRFPVLGFLLFTLSLCRRSTKFDLMCGEGAFININHASHPNRTESQGCPILGVLLYLCL